MRTTALATVFAFALTLFAQHATAQYCDATCDWGSSSCSGDCFCIDTNGCHPNSLCSGQGCPEGSCVASRKAPTSLRRGLFYNGTDPALYNWCGTECFCMAGEAGEQWTCVANGDCAGKPCLVSYGCGNSCTCKPGLGGNLGTCIPKTSCNGETCSSNSDCSDNCFCADGSCQQGINCAGAYCEDTSDCGTFCFCSSDRGGTGSCVGIQDCNMKPCGEDGGCGPNCSCDLTTRTCKAAPSPPPAGSCSATSCSGPDECGTECFCAENTKCVANAQCGLISCADGGTCGPSCTCVDGTCETAGPNPAGDLFMQTIHAVAVQSQSALSEAVVGQLSALGLNEVTLTFALNSTEQANTCSKDPNSAELAPLKTLGQAFSSVVNDVVTGTMASNTAVAEALTSKTLSASLAAALATYLEAGAGGLGLGVGFSLQCDGRPVWGFGVGGGAGAGLHGSHPGWGGGGGAGTSDGNVNVGGGGDCQCSGTACSCTPHPDTSPSVPVPSQASRIQSLCDGTQVTICAEGGGGGALTDSGGCKWSGGFSLVATQVDYSAEPDSPVLSLTTGSCAAVDGGNDAVGAASKKCAVECGSPTSVPNFSSCFCQCFKSTLPASVNWRDQVTCP